MFPTPVQSPTDGTVLPRPLHATCHMTTVASPPVAPTALVRLLMLATSANVRVALPVRIAQMWTTVLLIIPALLTTLPPVLTNRMARGPFASVTPAGEGTTAIWTLTNARVTPVMEVIALITQGATRATVHRTRLG